MTGLELRARALRGPDSLWILALAALSSLANGCGVVDVPVLRAAGGADAGGHAGADAGPDSGASTTAPPTLGTLAEYCGGSGPPTLVDSLADGGPVATCPDQLAQRAFRYALCMCENYVSDHALIVDAFDGSQGAYAPGTIRPGGSVGVNGDLHPTGAMQIGGSLWASNSTDIDTTAVTIAGELHAQGEVRPSPSLTVQADAWMASGIQTTGSVTVGGTLHVPTGEPIDVGGTQAFGTPVGTPFRVDPACDCTESQFVDVAGVVATYEAHNDDQGLGIEPNALENVQTDVAMMLPCGRIFLTQIAANQATIHLTASGRVALFVAGDLSTADFVVDVPAGSELDLFVGGNVTVRGAFQVGDASNPARARTYVGGSTVNVGAATTLAGNLYAPRAGITLGGSALTTLYGSMFASSLTASADLTIHYDEAILTPTSTPACASPARCSTACDCAGQACNSGTCGACVENTQCCAPLVCGPHGTCVAGVLAP